jgi:hypothetical protein
MIRTKTLIFQLKRTNKNSYMQSHIKHFCWKIFHYDANLRFDDSSRLLVQTSTVTKTFIILLYLVEVGFKNSISNF